MPSSASGRSAASSAKPYVSASGRSCARRRPHGIADVDRRRRATLEEEPALGLEVGVHRPVQVEVVLGQVREGERGEVDAVESPERGAVRGRLHRAASVARVEHLAECALEVDRLGRRAHGRAPLAADPELDRPDQARLPPRRFEDRVEQECGRRLPVRPGDACDLELLGRSSEELDRRRGHRLPRVRDDELRHARGHGVLDDERRRSGIDRALGELVPVEPRSRAHRRRARPGRPHGCHRRDLRSRPGCPRRPGSEQGFLRCVKAALGRREGTNAGCCYW